MQDGAGQIDALGPAPAAGHATPRRRTPLPIKSTRPSGHARRATLAAMNPLHPKKLLLSKWTATQPVDKDKHFLVVELVLPDDPAPPIEAVELEAVMSRQRRTIAWRALRDPALWRQGWL